jgi:hypothetical protein
MAKNIIGEECFFDSCNDDELEEIMSTIDSPTFINFDNLYDEQKLKLLKTSFDKFSLEELEQRLK